MPRARCPVRVDTSQEIPFVAVYRFEELVAWQRARELANRVYQATGQEPFRKDFGLSSQIQRSAVSVMANIAEGFEKNRMGEFGRYLDIAKGSLGELRSHLYIAGDLGYVSEAAQVELFRMVDDTGRVLAGLRASLPVTGRVAPGTRHQAPGPR